MCSYPTVILLDPSLPEPEANILISHDGHACISDSALLTIASDKSSSISSHIEGGTAPWMSPELLDPESFRLKKCRLTKESDCYALGMVVYEILSGKVPFSPSNAPVLKILRGERPERPQGAEGTWFTDGIWGMLELCWKYQPGDRVGAETVLSCLEGNPSPAQSPSPIAAGGVGTDGDDQSDDTMSILSASSSFHPRLISNYPCGITGLPNAGGDNGLPAPLHRHPSCATSSTIAPRKVLKEGWVSRLLSNARRMIKAVIKRCRLYQAKRAPPC